MMSSGDFQELQERLSKALVDTTRTAGQLANEDLAFHRALNPTLNEPLDQQNRRLLSLANSLTRAAVVGTHLSAPRLSDVDSIDDEWKNIVDVLDNLLERADASLDEYTGVIKKTSAPQVDPRTDNNASSSRRKLDASYRFVDVEKPQLQFADVLSNHETAPFKPLLGSKPHAILPLVESLQVVEAESGAKIYENPYKHEICAAQIPDRLKVKQNPVQYQPFDSTDAIFVDSLDAVRRMLERLKDAKEIAIDLEHHEEHSYIGIVSLMQISTREQDWIIDTLKPWRRDLQVLNEVFTDPSIVKVLHGSTMDIIWLQRDLGLYVVGLFDTYHASRALLYPKNSLAFLLKKFVDFDAAKQYQMADWRIRPLPREMFNYARSDTHFLLYIFDMMRNELIDNSDTLHGSDLVDGVMANSKQEALQRYERPFYDEARGSGQSGWYAMLARWPAMLNKEQFAVFRAVHKWRDQTARAEDESLNYIMPRKVLYSIARNLPTNVPSLLGCSHPITKTIQQNKGDLLDRIMAAKASSDNSPEMESFFEDRHRLLSNQQSDRIGTSSKQASNQDIGATTDMVRPREPLPLRAKTSALWGPAFSETRSLQTGLGSAELSAKLHLVLPIPQLTADVSLARETEADQVEELVTDIPTPDDATMDGQINGSNIFTLKEPVASRKRKYQGSTLETAASNGVSSGLDGETQGTAMGDQEVTEQQRLKQERRLEKKRLKKEKSNGQTRSTEPAVDRDAAPFDYANAPSVIHPSKGQDKSRRPAKSAKPYAKSLDTPKGLPRLNREAPGQSMTYRTSR